MIVGDIDIAASFADDRTAGGKVTGPPLDPVARLVDALLVGAEDADGHAGGRLVIEFGRRQTLPLAGMQQLSRAVRPIIANLIMSPSLIDYQSAP
jgi:hypothetical protein